ncbi:MAG: hypothetical protein WEC34_13035 [Acidimicrobiia bacterium]
MVLVVRGADGAGAVEHDERLFVIKAEQTFGVKNRCSENRAVAGARAGPYVAGRDLLP